MKSVRNESLPILQALTIQYAAGLVIRWFITAVYK